MEEEQRKNYIKENWFKEHIAEFERLSEKASVLNFHKPGTIEFSVTYIFYENYLVIKGDIGEAMFCLTEKAELSRVAQYDTYYLFSKRKLGDYMKFNSEKAITEFAESMEECKENCENDELAELKELVEEFTNVIRNEISDSEQLAFHLNTEYYTRISKFDQECCDWIYSIGEEISDRALGWCVGLQMAYEQLKKERL